MKTKTLFVLAGVAVLLSACIPSVNPFYTEKDVVFDPRLLGTWGGSDNTDEFWKFEEGDKKFYQLTISESGGKIGKFGAKLFKLDQTLFLDLTPAELDLKDKASLISMSVIPGHLLIRVRQIEPYLRTEMFDWDWLEKYLREHPRAVAHRGDGKDEGLVLTATPRELQSFVLKHLKEGELFKKGDNEGCRRITNAPPAATSAK